MGEEESCFGEVEGLVQVSLFFFKRYIPFPDFVVEGFAIAGQLDEEEALGDIALFLEVEADSNKIFGSKKLVCFLIIEFVGISCDVDKLKFVFDIWIFDEFVDDAFVVGVELAEGGLKEGFEAWGLGVSESHSGVKAEIFFFGVFLGKIVKDDGAISFGVFGVVDDFGNKGILARFVHLELIG